MLKLINEHIARCRVALEVLEARVALVQDPQVRGLRQSATLLGKMELKITELLHRPRSWAGQAAKGSKTLSGSQYAHFLRFWSAYPVHQGKRLAEEAWLHLDPNSDLVEEILEAIAQQKRCSAWQAGYIPSAVNWLQGHRWEDKARPEVSPG